MDYYKQQQFLAQVDENDKILGKIEKWDCHKKGILHRGYTCILIYQNSFVLQHRKHPVFDGVFDLSFSSHPVYRPELVSESELSFPRKRESRNLTGSPIKSRMTKMLKRTIVLSESERIQHDKIGLQTMENAIYDGLKREWNLEKKDLISQPKFLKEIYYQAKDPNSDYTEHEIDYIYSVELKNLPNPNLDFAYDFKLVKKLKIENLKLKINIAPWIKTLIKEKLI